jgi:anti-anti-sigma regulatory factor
MEISLRTDGRLAALKLSGDVGMGDTAALSSYLGVARENGAVRCILDLAACTNVPTTILALLMREAQKLADAGGVLVLSGVGEQNPFLAQAVTSGKFPHYRTVDQAWEAETRKAAEGDVPAAD